jgi:hypothetical protein
MRTFSKLGTSLVVVLLISVVQAAAAAPAIGPAVKQTKSPIATVAMDGTRVAYASGSKVYVWNTLTRATTLMSGNYSSHTRAVRGDLARSGPQAANAEERSGSFTNVETSRSTPGPSKTKTTCSGPR